MMDKTFEKKRLFHVLLQDVSSSFTYLLQIFIITILEWLQKLSI